MVDSPLLALREEVILVVVEPSATVRTTVDRDLVDLPPLEIRAVLMLGPCSTMVVQLRMPPELMSLIRVEPPDRAMLPVVEVQVEMQAQAQLGLPVEDLLSTQVPRSITVVQLPILLAKGVRLAAATR